jgi:Mg/Co/Ni transporter MgtE
MQLDGLTLFGLLSLSAMLVFYALEHRSHWLVLAMAGGCIAASVYGSFRAPGPSAFSN